MSKYTIKKVGKEMVAFQDTKEFGRAKGGLKSYGFLFDKHEVQFVANGAICGNISEHHAKHDDAE